MSQIFKQKSNKTVAFAFTGLIVVSQLMVLNMGYQIPWYFLTVLIILCSVIIWSMLDSRCIIAGDTLESKVGPFVQKIDIQKIESIKVTGFKSLLSRTKIEQVHILFNQKKRLSISLEDINGFLKAVKKQNSKIIVERTS